MVRGFLFQVTAGLVAWTLAEDYNLGMRFARIVYSVAAAWGILLLAPLLFAYNYINAHSPWPLTHPENYYGFVWCALLWQFAFLLIARDPIRYRALQGLAILEKFGYGGMAWVLYLQHRVDRPQSVLASVDLLLGVLFIIARSKTPATSLSSSGS